MAPPAWRHRHFADFADFADFYAFLAELVLDRVALRESAGTRTVAGNLTEALNGIILFGPEIGPTSHAGPTERLADRLGHHR